MKKVMLLILVSASFSASALAEGTPVMDSQVANELQQIKVINQQILAELQQNKMQMNALNCTDGEKSYSPGMKITNVNQKYRCENVNGHGEWKEVGAFQ